jgi:serine/threonine protein kinase HipA of HipAB toxin-antitoxin module
VQLRRFAFGGTLIPCRRHRHPQRRSIDDISFLCSASGSPVPDFRNLLDAVIFNLLIGNNEVHTKNFALLYVIDGQPRLAPLYDLVFTVYYSQIENHLTMKIGREAKTQIAIAFEQRFIVND